MKALERIVEQKIPSPEPETIFSFVNSDELPSPLIVFENVSLGYDRSSPVLAHLNLRIDSGDKIGLLGRNGNGKSTLAKGIAGKLMQFSGEVSFSSKLKIGYFAQHQLDELEPELNAIEHLLEIDPEATSLKLRNRLGGVGLVQEKNQLAPKKKDLLQAVMAAVQQWGSMQNNILNIIDLLDLEIFSRQKQNQVKLGKKIVKEPVNSNLVNQSQNSEIKMGN